MDMRGRVAVVTGGAGHIGEAACEALAELGASVVVLDLSAEACAATAERLRARFDVRAAPLAIDLADVDALDHAAKSVENDFGRLDVLIHCAALVGSSNLKGWVAPFTEQSVDAWRRALDVNLTAPFALTKACAPMLTASGRGSVINVASIYGVVGPDMSLYDDTPMGNPAAYGASKGGLLQLTRWLSTVMAPHVRVNALTPGGVARGQPAIFQERYRRRTPLARMATEEDFKGAVAFLASDMSAYVTGQNLMVDGGWTTW
jgi:NAD(P)-dependent dehydrogenase (short-subunit alcohol dehydrogenase family)